jgi:hypothetical protein
MKLFVHILLLCFSLSQSSLPPTVPASTCSATLLMLRFLQRTLRVNVASSIAASASGVTAPGTSVCVLPPLSDASVSSSTSGSTPPLSVLHVQVHISDVVNATASSAWACTTGPMRLDAAARRTLELTQSWQGWTTGSDPTTSSTSKGWEGSASAARAPHSLIGAMDKTQTSAGSRLLSAHLTAPLTDRKQIEARLDCVSFFHRRSPLLRVVRRQLVNCQDLERCLQRLSLRRGGPRDLLAVARTLLQAHLIHRHILMDDSPASPQWTSLPPDGKPHDEADSVTSTGSSVSQTPSPSALDLSPLPPASADLPTLLSDCLARFPGAAILSWARDVLAAIRSDAPASIDDGGFIVPGWKPELDRLWRLKSDHAVELARLQAEYAFCVLHCLGGGGSLLVFNSKHELALIIVTLCTSCACATDIASSWVLSTSK